MGDRTWVVLDAEGRCGRCGVVIPARTWFLELRVPGVPALQVRCEACAQAADLVVPRRRGRRHPRWG